ncbi:FitA-like ribbon-helix-helix domain-containing protein [Nocardia alni]|uniref:FitA-like ribbon-helix-helix domain-containing protein n=1 Tax=Nocardia alni TaxID=2815723 RepID=UPI001C224387|nr:hypothetical protein [Nocardia alni]
MNAVTIQDVPDDVLTAIKVHADQLGQSLQAYILTLLTQDATNVVPVVIPGGETRGERAIRRLRESKLIPESRGLSTDQLMEITRGD